MPLVQLKDYMLPRMPSADDNPTPINLTASVRENMLGDVNNIGSMTGIFHDMLQTDKLTKGLAYQYVGYLSSQAEHLRKTLCLEDLEQSERAQLMASLKAANTEIRDLKEGRGAGATAEVASAVVVRLAKRLIHWWAIHGLGNLSNFSVSEYGSVTATLTSNVSFAVPRAYRALHASMPLAEVKTQWLNSLEDLGFSLVEDRSEVEFSDRTQRALKDLIYGAMPDANIVGQACGSIREGDVFVLKSVDIWLPSLAALEGLAPTPRELSVSI